MHARVSWTGDRSFIGRSGTGHNFVFGTKEADGTTPGPSPMELMLIGTGGCSAYDVVSILEKMRQRIEDVVVELSAERADATPAVFTKIHMHFIVKGRGVDPAKVEKAINMSVETYCSASAMMAKTAEVTHDFELVDTSD